MSGEDSEKATRIGPKSSVSIMLAGSLLLGAGYLGKVEMRIESLEADRTEVRADVKELLRKVDDIRVHVAAMDRRAGAAEERVSETKRLPRGDN